MTDTTLDLSGLECPIPSIRTKRQLRQMQAGDRLTLICTDPLAEVDIPHLLVQLGHGLTQLNRESGKLVFVIAVGSGVDDAAIWPPDHHSH